MRHDAEGPAWSVSARTRTIAPALRRALLYRDWGHRFSGVPERFIQGPPPRLAHPRGAGCARSTRRRGQALEVREQETECRAGSLAENHETETTFPWRLPASHSLPP